MRHWLLLSIFLLPGVAGQAATATIDVLHDVDLASVQGQGCDGAAAIGAFVPTPQGFVLEETNQEQGCLEAVYAFTVPDGARAVELLFHAEKDVTSSIGQTGGAPMDVRSAAGFRQGDVDIEELFDPADREEDAPQNLSRVLAPGRAVAAWRLQDSTSLGGVPPLTLPYAGNAATLAITAPRIVHLDIPVLAATDTKDVDVRRDHVDQHLLIHADVPEADGTVHLTFRIDNAWSIHGVKLPDGRSLDLDAFESREAGGVLHLMVPGEVIAREGPGRYTAIFAGTAALEPTPALMPVLLVLALLPIVAGVLATRGAVGFRQRAAGPYVNTAATFLRSVYALWATYVVIGVLVLGGRLGLVLVTWPIQVEAMGVYLGLFLITVAFVTLEVAWRRRLDRIMQEELVTKERVNLDLKRSNDELQQFAYIASHDLQEPLRTVARFTQLLQRRYGEQLDESARDFMAYSVDGAQRMQRLLDDLLAYSRVDTSGGKLGPVSLDDVLHGARANLAGAIDESGATITADPLPKVLGDASQLNQVFQNLLGNAIKFRRPGTAPRIHVRASRTERHWRIEVQDDGIGIPEEHQARIFTVFQRIHGQDAYEGTGIGLAVCKKIIERHGGQIGVTSDKGSTFWFTLVPA